MSDIPSIGYSSPFDENDGVNYTDRLLTGQLKLAERKF